MAQTVRSWLLRAAVLLTLSTVALAQQRPTADVRGQLLDSGGERFRVTLWHDDMARGSLDALAETIADEDGAFVFEGVRWFARGDWGRNKVVLIARGKHRVGLYELRRGKAPIDALQIRLFDTVDVRGTLRDAVSGQPVPNARIWPAILAAQNEVWLTEPLLSWRAETDEQGAFVIRGLPKGVAIKMLAGGRDHARTWIEVPDTSAPVDASLPRGGRIAGKVLLPDGKPAGRVRVITTANGAGYGKTTTDDDGAFELQSLEEGVYKVWAVAADLTVICVQNVDVTAGETSEGHVVQLVRGGFIVGRIVDKDTGEPFVPGPWSDVAMYGPARGPGGSCECAKIEDDGTFRIRAPAGTNRIYLRGAGGYEEPSEDVSVLDGEETEVLWEIRRNAAKPRPGKKGQDNISGDD